MRSFLSALLTLVAIAATILAVPSFWLDQRIVDQAGFVSTVGPMAENQKVKDYLADEIAAQATARTDLPIAGALVRPLAGRYTESEQFQQDFADVVGQQHAFLFEEPAPGSDTSVMQLDITAMINRALNLSGGNAIQGPVVVELTNGASGLEAGRYAEVGGQITLLAWGSAAVAVISAVLALLIARRRGTVFAWLGLGVVAAGVSTWAMGLFFADRAKQEVAGAESSGRQVAELIIDGAYDDVTRVALIVGGVGVAMFAIGILGRLISGRR
ncbi:hypothetical protein ACWFOS_17930 [Gordonia terrae]